MNVKTVIGGYLWYVEVNFQRLHNKFGRVGYVNLTDDQGLFKEHEREAKGHDGDAKEHEGDAKEHVGYAKEGQGCLYNS